MRILVDNKPVERLTPKQEKTFFLSKLQEQVKGRILTPDEATAVFIRNTKLWYMIMGAIAVVLMVAAMTAGVVGEPRNAVFFVLFGMAMIGALVLFLALMLRHRTRVFGRTLAHRGEGLMPVGTVLAIDAQGLSVGPETFAWPALTVDTMELTSGSLPSGDTSTDILIVERLSVAAGAKVFVLDRAMTTNGIALVDNAWRRLRPAAG